MVTIETKFLCQSCPDIILSSAQYTVCESCFSNFLQLNYDIHNSCSFLHSFIAVSRSLANNNVKFLPRDLFIDLDSLIEL